MDKLNFCNFNLTNDECQKIFEHLRWGELTICPYCTSTSTSALPMENRHHCNVCNTSFSVTVQTIFHRTRLPLRKWFIAISMILNSNSDPSARELAKHINVNKNTAMRMIKKIRQGMHEKDQRRILLKLANLGNIEETE